MPFRRRTSNKKNPFGKRSFRGAVVVVTEGEKKEGRYHRHVISPPQNNNDINHTSNENKHDSTPQKANRTFTKATIQNTAVESGSSFVPSIH